jgi:hypothetical protein
MGWEKNSEWDNSLTAGDIAATPSDARPFSGLLMGKLVSPTALRIDENHELL